MSFSGEQNGDRSKRQLYWNVMILFLPFFLFQTPKKFRHAVSCEERIEEMVEFFLCLFKSIEGRFPCLFSSFYIFSPLAISNEDYKLKICPESSLDQSKPNGWMLHEPSFWFCRCILALQVSIITSDLNIPTCGSCIIHFWFDFIWHLYQKGRESILERGAFPFACSQPDACCKTLAELPQLLSFLSERLLKCYINCILKVDANRLCFFPKAAEQLLSGEWCRTSSWEVGLF